MSVKTRLAVQYRCFIVDSDTVQNDDGVSDDHPWLSAVLHPAGLISGSHGAMPQQRLVAVRKWRLGTTTRGHPSAIIADVLRTLQAHRIAWKKVGPYTYKCRKVLQLSGAPLTSAVLS